MADLVDLIIEHESQDGDLTLEDEAKMFQTMINSGDAWKLQGSYGRAAMGMIESGYCMLGKERRRDYYGNKVPSRFDVIEGTKGSEGFVAANHPEVLEAIKQVE